jgi:ubiquinone/menaquinone biosynthesis C-methylase UbiE
MSSNRKPRVCPVECAGTLDFGLRKLLQSPKKILKPHVKEGMTVLDVGCGPGFFTVEMARLVGKTGRVIAADLQEGMLARLKAKIRNADWADRIIFHKCRADGIGLSEKCDFVLVFYMLHEVPQQSNFFKEIRAFLKPDGKVLIVEPKWHVSRNDFLESISLMKQAGFSVLAEPKIRFSRAVVVGSIFR